MVCMSLDRKSTRLNSSHVKISYAVFCLKKKTQRRPARRASACASPSLVLSWLVWDPAATPPSTLSLHDALPISSAPGVSVGGVAGERLLHEVAVGFQLGDLAGGLVLLGVEQQAGDGLHVL